MGTDREAWVCLRCNLRMGDRLTALRHVSREHRDAIRSGMFPEELIFHQIPNALKEGQDVVLSAAPAPRWCLHCGAEFDTVPGLFWHLGTVHELQVVRYCTDWEDEQQRYWRTERALSNFRGRARLVRNVTDFLQECGDETPPVDHL